MPQSYLERYGIITVPEPEENTGVKIGESGITLADGRKIEFFVRTQKDDELWQGEMNYFLEKFRDKIPISRIEGRPDEVLPPSYEVLEGRDSEKTFGISFGIEDDAKFFGLGEAGRDRVQLRGGSYQNWAVYQFDEIPIPLVYSNKNWGLFIAAQDRHFVDIDDNMKGRITVAGNFDDLDVYLLYGDSMKDIIRLYTDIDEHPERYAPLVPFNIEGVPSGEASALLSDMGFYMRGGLHCAPLAHKKLGTLETGVVRFAPSAFNTPEDVSRLIWALRKRKWTAK